MHHNHSLHRTPKALRAAPVSSTLGAICEGIVAMQNPVMPACPSCSIELNRSTQRRMSPFWGGFPAVPCVSCGANLRWHSALHRKLRFGGLLFKVGLGGFLLSLALIFAPGQITSAAFIAPVSFALLVAGVFVTSTGPDTPRVEVVGDGT
jgi:endogenous inhibitor of DNA gyrase (YacG/DUF329 family)